MEAPKIFDLNGEINAISGSTMTEPNRESISPSDLSLFTPYGNGVYGDQDQSIGHPFTGAPMTEPCGGVIYFSNEITITDFYALMRILEIQSRYETNSPNDFSVFTAESQQPGKDNYLTQMRIVSKFGLRFLFRTLDDTEYDKFQNQELSISEALWLFIEHEKIRWGTSWTEDHGLVGKFGGDGHFAREELAFGLMLESRYYQVVRIWSRAWLVTK